LQNKVLEAPIEYVENIGGAHGPSIDGFAILVGVLGRWKLITAITLCALIATTYGVIELVPSRYKSTVEILVYDPQGQIDTTIQKPISPFVEALGFEAMDTEIKVLQSKSVALRVASDMGMDTDPEFQSHDQIADLVKKFRDRIADLVNRLGFPDLGRAFDNGRATTGVAEEKSEKLDRAADALRRGLEISQEAYIITVSMTSRDPIKAQRMASTIADVYLESQREARQEALEHVADWLKGRVDNLQSHLLETESSIEKLKVDSGIHDDAEFDSAKEEQTVLTTQLMTARDDVSDKRARLEQALNAFDTNGDIDTIPELTGNAKAREPPQRNGDTDTIPNNASIALRELRRRRMELDSRLADLQSRFGERNIQIVSVRADLATVNKQIDIEKQYALATMKNARDIAVRREQDLEASLHSLAARLNSEAYIKLQQLRHVADTDNKEYQSYLSQYNDISERRVLQGAGARIISPATLPRSPTSSRHKFYALGGAAGLACGLLLAFLLEYFGRGLKTSAQIEQSFGLPVVGNIPLVLRRKTRGASYYRPLDRMVNEPLSHLSEAVRAMRISLELSSANPKVILVTSALPAEGKSTAAMLLVASSASSGKTSILLDCDLRLHSTSKALRNKGRPGLSELLVGTAKLMDVITVDPVTKAYMIPAGSMTPNAADLLMSQAMLDLIAALRDAFDYIVMDAPPLLPVVDALALATVADKILLIVEWCHTPYASIYEAFKVLGPEANRVAGIVLNKVEFDKLPGYGRRYYYRSKYLSNA
jgi:capsular exopolysaccharide synthesis family protein